MIVYRFKVSFEDVDEVERMIDIRANQTFRDLYRSIVDSIGFDHNVTASYFISGDNWRKGREITNAEKEGVLTMAESKLNTFVNDPHQKILLITHDEMEWTLRIQLVKIQKSDDALAYPQCVRSIGLAPKQTKVISIGLATNEFEELVDEIIREDERPDISEMGFDDGGEDADDNLDDAENDEGDDDIDDDSDEESGDYYEDDED